MKFQLIIDKSKEEAVTVTAHSRRELTDKIEALVLADQGADTLTAYTEDEAVLLPIEQIECVTVLDGKTYAVDPKGRQLRLRLRLYEVEQLLPGCFIRINKSSIANERRLAKFRSDLSGGVTAVFRSGYEEYVSRRCFSEIKRRFQVK